ncbi:MAG: galactokinase, partial [Vicinamibacterales bacterium]|nr:galactokinase [Vicinamibacterales bacterium]
MRRARSLTRIVADLEHPVEMLEELVDQCSVGFTERYGQPAKAIASAPGRINVIGEHTDYNEGLALSGAIDRWVVVALSPRGDRQMRVYSEAFNEETTVSLEDPIANEVVDWGRIPLGAGLLFAELTAVDAGFDALIGGNVPMGAGLSSSAALEVALLNALRHAFDISLDDLELVHIAQGVEHEYLGVKTGLMDQYTSQFAHRKELMLVDFRALSHEYIEASLKGWVWLLLDSGVRRQLADSAYGMRVRETHVALKRVVRVIDKVSSFRDLKEEHLAAVDDDVLRRRLRHYVTENNRVQQAAKAITAGEPEALGTLLRASHVSLRDDYAVSCAELEVLVDVAAYSDECAGARMMGGGFGGCTINLVKA